MKPSIILAGLVALATLAGCGSIPGTSAYVEREAREGLSRGLVDAESARFQDVRVVAGASEKEPKIICGLVNAKNRLGAYVGFRRFVVERGTGFAVVSPDADKHSSDEDTATQAGFDNVYPADRCPK